MTTLARLLAQVRACDRCAADLPLGPRPVLQARTSARLLIVGQAPGRKVHESGIPFDDASGERLRAWLGVSRDAFYDARRVALLPMGLCYPGRGAAGDLPPRRECLAWRAPVLERLPRIELTLVLGAYAQAWHLGASGRSVTAVVAAWRDGLPATIPLPHPSPRNRRWLERNPWFERELLPVLRARVAEVLG